MLALVSGVQVMEGNAVTYLQEYGLFSRHRGQPSPRIEL